MDPGNYISMKRKLRKLSEEKYTPRQERKRERGEREGRRERRERRREREERYMKAEGTGEGERQGEEGLF